MSASQTLYLPYSLDDQEVECFKAELSSGQIVLRWAEVNWNGWAMDLNDLSEFITHAHEIRHESLEVFGSYGKDALVNALRNPEVVDA